MPLGMAIFEINECDLNCDLVLGALIYSGNAFRLALLLSGMRRNICLDRLPARIWLLVANHTSPANIELLRVNS